MRPLATLHRDLAQFAKYHLVRRPAAGPEREAGLGVSPLAFDLERYVDEVRARDGAQFTVATEASVTYEGREHPILSVRSRGAADATLLVLAGVHGNEHAGLLAVPRILDVWASPRVRLVVLTPVNPVGARATSRYNGGGYDINRDFERFDTREARLVRDIYDRDRPDFVASLHEGPQDATFMFANRFVDGALAQGLLAALAAGGTALAREDYFGLRLDPPGLSPSSRAARALTKLWARALGMKASIAYSEDRGIPEIVLESSWRLSDEEARVRAHVDLVLALGRLMPARSRRPAPST